MSKPVLEGLIAARALIEDPKRWTTGALARHANGNPICYFTDKAVCWCAIGALGKITIKAFTNYDDNETYKRATRFLLKAAKDVAGFEGTIIKVNDDARYGHPFVLRMYDLAIEQAQKEDI